MRASRDGSVLGGRNLRTAARAVAWLAWLEAPPEVPSIGVRLALHPRRSVRSEPRRHAPWAARAGGAHGLRRSPRLPFPGHVGAFPPSPAG